jgi:hypothetical protein
LDRVFFSPLASTFETRGDWRRANGLESAGYEIRTRSAKCGGLETNDRRERFFSLCQCPRVRRFSRGGLRLLGFSARLLGPENIGPGWPGGAGGPEIQRSLNFLARILLGRVVLNSNRLPENTVESASRFATHRSLRRRPKCNLPRPLWETAVQKRRLTLKPASPGQRESRGGMNTDDVHPTDTQ